MGPLVLVVNTTVNLEIFMYKNIHVLNSCVCKGVPHKNILIHNF